MDQTMPGASHDPGLSLLVLGCDGSWPGPGGAGSGYLVRSGTTCVLVDAGPGTFANFQRLADPARLDAIVISHHHPDHWTDLYGLATQARFVSGRTGIPVFAPRGVAQRAQLEDAPALDWRTVTDGDRIDIGDIACGFHRTEHSRETLAVRMDSGARSLGYSADSGPGWALADLGTELDLVLCEATYTTDHEGTAGHMSGRQAGEQAKRAAARRLVVTHRWPTVEASAVITEAEETFGARVEQAVIGKEFKL
ncbi:MAG TPA: MBL fold metallo-hydrolase [Acidimicrobiales bacterium]